MTTIQEAMQKALTQQRKQHPNVRCTWWVPQANPLARAVTMMQAQGVQVVADLRTPWLIKSNALPADQNMKPDRLKDHLGAAGIRYVRLAALGNKPSHPPFYHKGRLQIVRLQTSEPWRKEIGRLAKGLRTHHVAVLTDSPVPAQNLALKALHANGVRIHLLHKKP